jgi:2,5-diketo-D-gluconate reductase A
MTALPSVQLHNGRRMPLLGFGVFQVPDLAQCEQSIYDALMAGYRLIDTAAAYRNEEAVGRAIKRSGIPQHELFVTSKLWVQDATYAAAKTAYQTSLDKLQLDYLDLYLIHQPFNDLYGAWRALEELHDAGQVQAIGVSNLPSDRLVDLVLNNRLAPMVNQIEIHPFNQQVAAIQVMREYGVQPEGWVPFAEGKQNLFANETLLEIARRHQKSVGQVVLRWNIQREVVAIPKSVHQARIIENFDVFDFELSTDDMQRIGTLDEAKGLFVEHADPAFVKQINSVKLHE